MIKKYFFCILHTFFLCCISIASINAQSAAVPVDGTPLNILTWNLYMRPRIGFRDGQVKRAPEIVKQLIDKDYDIIVFQEAFDNKARKRLWKGLKEKYPYQSGAPKHKYFYKVSTGIFIVSKLPLTVVDHIYFSECGGSDCFAVKGAVLVSCIKNNHKVQVIGTHLQAANGKKKTGREIRESQYLEIKQKLLLPYSEHGVPQFFVGDLNTKKDNKEAYEHLLKTMEMEDGEITGENQYSSGGNINDFKDADAKPHLIDYVLCKRNGAKVSVVQRTVKIFKSDWSVKHKDLSDHFAVLANIILQ